MSVAWQRVMHLHQDLDLAPVLGAGLALQTPGNASNHLHRRQHQLLGGVVMVGSATWLADFDAISAGVGLLPAPVRQRVFTLPDGSLMQLNTR
jgi:ferric-dicitrate binding protein FerR (iron transport regulator)